MPGLGPQQPPLCWTGESAQLEYLGCHPAMPPASPQLHPPTRRAFLHLHTSPDCSDASPATALCFCPSQRQFWEEMEDLQHLHDQSCWDFRVSKGTETPRVSPDQFVLVLSAAPDQDISAGPLSSSAVWLCKPTTHPISVSPPVAEVLLHLCQCAEKTECMHSSQGTPKNRGAAVRTSQGSCAARSSAFPPGHTGLCWPSHR